MPKQRRDLTLSEKCNLLKSYDKLPKLSLRDAAAQLNISHSSLNKILKDRLNIERAPLENESVDRRRKRGGKDELVEIALKEWFTKVRERDARVNGPILRDKAKELATKLGKHDFVATEGWFQRWKKRENISFGKAQGEQGDADTEAASTWLSTQWPQLKAQYPPECIFNADETGLYFRALPDDTYHLKNKKAKGSKASKERLTVLCCASLNGDKEELLVIGKSIKPRCFKGIKTLPVDYKANSKAWMTSAIFEEWLTKWDKKLKKDTLLLVDNCPGHTMKITLKHLNVVFLPANTTSIVQPCDQGIINTFKGFYKTEVRRKVIRIIDAGLDDPSISLQANDIAKKVTVLEALHLAKEAWNKVSAETIRNCFRHGGFSATEEETVACVPEKPSDLSQEDYELWLTNDADLQVAYELNEDDICDELLRANDDNSAEPVSEDETEDEDPPPSNKDVINALAVLRRAVQHRADSTFFNQHYSYEREIIKLVEDGKKQTTMDKFFH